MIGRHESLRAAGAALAAGRISLDDVARAFPDRTTQLQVRGYAALLEPPTAAELDAERAMARAEAGR